MDELRYRIGLCLIPLIGDINAKKLLAYCGSAEAVFHEKKQKLIKIPGIGETIAEAVINNKQVLDRADEEIEFITKNNIEPLFFLDDNYPQRLKNCFDSPIMLYFKGNTNLNNTKTIGIVGTRQATDYGKNFCNQLIKDLANYQPLIVSGLAYGIDGAAHKAAIDNNIPTVGVLAHGLDMIYPTLHKNMAEKMLKNGGLLTEFLSKSNPDRENFPKRNRIVAGMCDAVIVVESGRKGGALITAEIANSYNRDVFAVPGKLNDAHSLGCNFLIKVNKAVLIESAADIEYILGWEKEKSGTKPIQRSLFIELTDEEHIIAAILKEDSPCSIDNICIKANMQSSKVVASLLNMEFSGIVACMPGKQYKLI